MKDTLTFGIGKYSLIKFKGYVYSNGTRNTRCHQELS